MDNQSICWQQLIISVIEHEICRGTVVDHTDKLRTASYHKALTVPSVSITMCFYTQWKTNEGFCCIPALRKSHSTILSLSVYLTCGPFSIIIQVRLRPPKVSQKSRWKLLETGCLLSSNQQCQSTEWTKYPTATLLKPLSTFNNKLCAWRHDMPRPSPPPW